MVAAPVLPRPSIVDVRSPM
ncbi:fadD11.1 [Mycobacterium tuberculosis UT205]|nr:fadD11.1 [Mycobacterium tuberculosis UT205]